MADFDNILESLKARRPIFHDEKDFQFALVNEMKQHGMSKISTEVSKFNPLLSPDGSGRERIDIIADGTVAIELKYPRKNFCIKIGEETFHLKGVNSVIKGRYRLWKDVWRVEQLVNNGVVKEGYAILLSNRPYWADKRDNDWLMEFSTKEGRVVTGTIQLRKNLSGVRKSTKEMHQEQFMFDHSYQINWKEWSSFTKRNGCFRYICLKCSNQS